MTRKSYLSKPFICFFELLISHSAFHSVVSLEWQLSWAEFDNLAWSAVHRTRWFKSLIMFSNIANKYDPLQLSSQGILPLELSRQKYQHKVSVMSHPCFFLRCQLGVSFPSSHTPLLKPIWMSKHTVNSTFYIKNIRLFWFRSVRNYFKNNGK